jgi:hypothetical protein
MKSKKDQDMIYTRWEFPYLKKYQNGILLPNKMLNKGYICLLVGGFNPSEKYEFVSWGDSSQYKESHKIPWFQTTNQ